MTGSRKLYAMPPIYRRWERHLISVGLVAYWVRFGLGLVAFPFVYTWWRMKRDPYRRESLSLATILAYFPNFPNFSILSYRCIILIWSFFFFYIYTSYNFFFLYLFFVFSFVLLEALIHPSSWLHHFMNIIRALRSVFVARSLMIIKNIVVHSICEVNN